MSRQTLASVAVLFLASQVFGQITNVTNNTSIPVPGSGHDYIGMLNETIDPASGSVNLRIETPTPPGRLLSMPFAFAYSTNGANVLGVDGNGVPTWASDNGSPTKGGWYYSIPTVTFTDGDKVVADPGSGHQSDCAFQSGFTFQDGAGTRHALGISSAQPYDGSSCLYPAQDVPDAGDDYYRASAGEPYSGLPSAQVASLDGTVYSFHCQSDSQISYCYPGALGSAMIAQQIEDRNGNIVTGTANRQGGFTYTDTLGRAVISASSFAGGTDTITVSGLSSYTVTWRTVTPSFTIPIQVTYGTGCGVNSIHLPAFRNCQHYVTKQHRGEPSVLQVYLRDRRP